MQTLAMKTYKDEQVCQTEQSFWNDPEWLGQVKSKVSKRKITRAGMVHFDAQYVFDIKRKKIVP